MPGAKLVVPMVPWADRAPPVLKREAAAQGGPSNFARLVVPVLPRGYQEKERGLKKKKGSAKQWGDFNRQAKRRKKTVTLALERYIWLVAQPCVYCGATENVGVDRVRNNESYTRENSVPCCGCCNMAKRSATLRAFVQRARAIAKTTRAVGVLERASSI